VSRSGSLEYEAVVETEYVDEVSELAELVDWRRMVESFCNLYFEFQASKLPSFQASRFRR
jgi:hypothetical protein